MKSEAIVAAGLVAVAASLAALPAQASGVFSNINRLNSTQCLDSATENDSKLQMWHCDSGDDEQWLAFRAANGKNLLVNRRNGMCVTAPGGVGHAVTLQLCNSDAPNQQWSGVTGPSASRWMNIAARGCLWAQNPQNRAALVLGDCGASDLRLYWLKP